MKGIVLMLDSIIALLLVVSIISLLTLFRVESSSPFFTVQYLHSLSEDVLNILSESTLREVITNKSLVEEYINQGILSGGDWDKNAIDVIGALWSANNTTEAANISKDILGNILPNNIGFQVLINDSEVYTSSGDYDFPKRPSYPSSLAEISSGRVASGYDLNIVSGYVARAFLTGIKGKRDSSYIYFGGYVGDGNITANITLPNFDKILEVYMEMEVGSNFTLYINNNQAGFYINGSSGGGNMTADKWYLTPSNYTLFHTGDNIIQINSSNRSSIGGGYFKVTYNTTELATTEVLGHSKIRLPGIDGVINLYDSFYIPGNLSSMEIFLKFKSNASMFMDVGNITVFYINDTSNVSNSTIYNSTLFALLNYSFLSQRTVPLRIGHYALNATDKKGNVTDVILTTSLVEAMNNIDIPNDTSYISRIDAAKALDRIFVNIVLNNTGNRVGLVAYKSDVPTEWITSLTNNNQSLISVIDGYVAKPGQRCLCCAINEAKKLLTDPLRKKYILVMSDGSAEKTTPSKCPANYTGDPNLDSINEACDAYQRYGIQVYSVGFGQDANNTLLQQIAACGHGEWAASSNYTGLEDIYKQFGSVISNQSLIFEFQKVAVSNFSSTLFPESYIEFNYTPLIIPYEYGEISLKREGDRIGVFSGNQIDKPCKQGWYNISQKVKVIDARMTSYSSKFWTDRLLINTSATGWLNNTVFNLTDFGYDYLLLGDPYTVEVPANLIAPGDNFVCIGTGFNVSDVTGGSPDDRLIYTLRVKGSVGYGAVNNTSDLAIVDAYQRLLNLVSDYVNVSTDEIQVENNSISGVPRMWGSEIIRVKVWS